MCSRTCHVICMASSILSGRLAANEEVAPVAAAPAVDSKIGPPTGHLFGSIFTALRLLSPLSCLLTLLSTCHPHGSSNYRGNSLNFWRKIQKVRPAFHCSSRR